MAKKKTDKQSELETVSFERAIEELTSIVDKIETGQVPLQQSLEQYEKGMGLIKHCRGILLDAEKRIEEIAAEQGDEEPDDTDDDDLEDEDDDLDDEDESLF